jgi:hypothetical protein
VGLEQEEGLFGVEFLADSPKADAAVVISQSEDVDWLAVVVEVQDGAELNAVDAGERPSEDAPRRKVLVAVEGDDERNHPIVQSRHQQVTEVRRPVDLPVLPFRDEVLQWFLRIEIEANAVRLLPARALVHHHFVVGHQRSEVLVERIPH